MEIAKEWHTTPMRIVGGSKLLWYVRACAVRESEIKRQHKIERDNKRRLDEMESRRK